MRNQGLRGTTGHRCRYGMIIGFGFMANGWAKLSRGPSGFAKLLAQIGAPLPQASAWASTFVEILGGLAIFVGAFVEVVSVPLIIMMLVAMFTVHLKYGFSSVNTIGLTEAGPKFGPTSYEINLLYIAGLYLPSSWAVRGACPSTGSSAAKGPSAGGRRRAGKARVTGSLAAGLFAASQQSSTDVHPSAGLAASASRRDKGGSIPQVAARWSLFEQARRSPRMNVSAPSRRAGIMNGG